MHRRLLLLLALVTLAPSVPAQNGDRAGEVQADLPAALAIPAAPALSPEEALASFALPEGYRIELVAAEPLVEDPVAAFFDHRGRLWVAEMRAYMPDVDGLGEDAPTGVIATLEDTDGDGRMDRRTVFLDGLVLPRALAPVGDALLAIAPPELFLARDLDGDGRADEREVLLSGLGGIASPEHAVNGLMHGLDNWILCANYGERLRLENGALVRQRVVKGGQWGISRDALGRVFYNTNSDVLRGDPYSSHYAARNPNLGNARGVNVRYAKDMATWPARITPGVNRGYRSGTLRDDYTLARVTGACAPLVFGGDALPAEVRGDAFVCEPCGNLVKRYRISEGEDGRPQAEQAYQGREFLTSTDERFRPVNLLEGPDGALYIVDLYRGILQHRLFVTTFLRKQILARGLDEPLGLGRIWRVVHDGVEPRGGEPLEEASWSQLAAGLSHPAQWWRSTVQRLLVEEGGGVSAAIEAVEDALATSPEALGRVHALWSLAGMGALELSHVLGALAHPDARVQHAGVRVSEPFLALGGPKADRVAGVLDALWEKGDPRLRRQLLLSLGEADSAQADEVLARRLAGVASSAELRSCALSGLFERELDFLSLCLQHEQWRTPEEGRGQVLKQLATCIAREGRSERIESLVALSAALPAADARRASLVQGVLAGRPKGPDGEPTYLAVARRPPALDALADSALSDALLWPGREGVSVASVRPLEPEEQARFDRGRELYAQTCASCHQASGLGEPGKAPHLRHSPWVLGSERRLARVVMAGMQGPLKLGGVTWDMEMPAWSAGDEDTAALLTYLRREWGHGADPVEPAAVAALRPEIEARATPFTAAELLELGD